MKKLFMLSLVIVLIVGITAAAGHSAQYWAKEYVAGDNEGCHTDIQQTVDGGYIIAGYTGFSWNYFDLWVFKLTSNGDISWQKAYDDGSDNWDGALCIQKTEDGGYIVSGVKDAPQFFAGGHAWVIKLYNNGNVAWQKTYRGSMFKLWCNPSLI